MDPLTLTIVVVVAIAALPCWPSAAMSLLRSRGRDAPPAPRPGTDYAPGVGDDATPPRDAPKRSVQDVDVLDREPEPAPDVDELEAPPADRAPGVQPRGRLHRLRARLARSNTALGHGLLALLSRDTHRRADLGARSRRRCSPPTSASARPPSWSTRLRTHVKVDGVADPDELRAALRAELVALVDPTMDRELAVGGGLGRPAVVLVVGVNGTGKTTTVGKLARVLVAEDKDVVLGAADTFRAAAADQLETWGARVGVPTIRADRDGADPAAVAFDAVNAGIETEADVVLIDTAGRLQNKAGLMDELGKVKRVIEKRSPVDEVLLVLDATTGQNGMRQAKVFSEVVNVTGIVLTKLDGTAKGGIVVAVQRELGVPVKLVGLGEGPDDLAPFDAEEFVDALLA